MQKINTAITKININVNWDSLSRFLIGILFVYSAVEKIVYLKDASLWLSKIMNIGLSSATIFLIIAIFIEIVFGSNLIWGKHKKDFTIKVLIFYTILITFIIDYSILGFNSSLLKNSAIIGGLIASMDAVHRKRNI